MLARTGSVVFGAIAMLAFLLALASFSFSRADGVAFYLTVAVVSSYLVARLMRGEMRRRREAGELPERRVPRRPITFPLGETVLAFAFWYAVAIAVDRVVAGTTSVFTIVAVAPFASFMLTALTIAGRHMAFRLTAEESEPSRDE